MALTFKVSSQQMAPDFSLHREGVSVIDTLPVSKKEYGVNTGHYRHAIIDVVPTGDADPTVEVLWWSEAKQEFVSEHTPIAKAGTGANTPYQFAVECLGRIMLVAVTAIVAGTVDISVAGYDLNHTL